MQTRRTFTAEQIADMVELLASQHGTALDRTLADRYGIGYRVALTAIAFHDINERGTFRTHPGWANALAAWAEHHDVRPRLQLHPTKNYGDRDTRIANRLDRRSFTRIAKFTNALADCGKGQQRERRQLILELDLACGRYQSIAW